MSEAASGSALLRVRDLATHFFTRTGVVKAVDGVSFDVDAGEIVGLVGGRKAGQAPAATPNTWLQYLHTAIPALGRKEGNGAEVLSFSYPGWEPWPLPDERIIAPGPGRGEQERQSIDPATIMANIAPVPHSDSIAWKKATDLLLPLKEQAIERNIPRAAECLSPLTRGSLFHRCLELITIDGSFDMSRVEREFPEVIFLPGFWLEIGMAAEPSGFGCKVSLFPDRTPLAHPMISSLAELDRLSLPDPRTDGLMPVILNFYRRLEPRVNDAGHVIKVVAARGPLAVAAHLLDGVLIHAV